MKNQNLFYKNGLWDCNANPIVGYKIGPAKYVSKKNNYKHKDEESISDIMTKRSKRIKIW